MDEITSAVYYRYTRASPYTRGRWSVTIGLRAGHNGFPLMNLVFMLCTRTGMHVNSFKWERNGKQGHFVRPIDLYGLMTWIVTVLHTQWNYIAWNLCTHSYTIRLIGMGKIMQAWA